jgi:hypothetical protein
MERVQMGSYGFGSRAAPFTQEVLDMVHGRVETVHGGVDLCPSTSGEENHPVHAVTVHEAAQCPGEVGSLDFCAPEGFDGRRAVIESNGNDRPVRALTARPLGQIGQVHISRKHRDGATQSVNTNSFMSAPRGQHV